MSRIDNMVELVGALDSPYITVHQERCALVRNRNANCLRCAEACTSGCISFDGAALRVHPERCVGCGTCATACPTCCLEAHHPNDEQLIASCLQAAEQDAGTVAIACGALLAADGAAGTGAPVRVECLGRIEESLLITLAAQGVNTVTLAHGACAACAHAPGRAMAERVLDATSQLLAAWGSPLKVQLTAWVPASARHDAETGTPPASHPRPHSALGHAPQAGHFEKVMADGTLPHFLPDRRERLLDALAQLGTPQDVPLVTRLWAQVSIDLERCRGCRMCTVFCPTGSLRRIGESGGQGTFGVEHAPGDCVNCGTCAAICPDQAITLTETLPAPSVIEGGTTTFTLSAPSFQKGTAHGIWNSAKLLTNIGEVYER